MSKARDISKAVNGAVLANLNADTLDGVQGSGYLLINSDSSADYGLVGTKFFAQEKISALT
jgi:hypothetical protein